MTLIKADGTSCAIDTALTLGEMQRLVGGYVEFVTIGGTPDRRELLIVDEEGLLKNKAVNWTATRLYRGNPPRHAGVIVGNVVQCHCLNIGTEEESYE
jgi:hypothetical protein